jgi:hypothetical protein
VPIWQDLHPAAVTKFLNVKNPRSCMFYFCWTWSFSCQLVSTTWVLSKAKPFVRSPPKMGWNNFYRSIPIPCQKTCKLGLI